MRFDVIFKGENEHHVGTKYLERLIPGDEGFEPPAVPMIEHSKDVPILNRSARRSRRLARPCDTCKKAVWIRGIGVYGIFRITNPWPN